MNDQQGRDRLAEYVKTARRTLYGTVEKAIRSAEVNRGTWQRVEAGQPVRDDRLVAIERALGWSPGDAWKVLSGSEPSSVSGPGQDAEPDEDSLLYRRPEGLSDAEWEQLKRETRTYIEWQLDRASRER